MCPSSYFSTFQYGSDSHLHEGFGVISHSDDGNLQTDSIWQTSSPLQNRKPVLLHLFLSLFLWEMASPRRNLTILGPAAQDTGDFA